MKDKEAEYLDTLFSMSSDEIDESEIDFPLVDVPEDLSDKLYAITQPGLSRSDSINQPKVKSWPKFASVAASLLMAVVLVQVYQQQQTLKQLEQAQSDLATALHYLGEANQITRAQMLNTLNKNMKKAALTPVIEIGRDAVLPTVESLESATKRSRHTL
ncbi:MAG: hypothetical protein ACJAQ6_001753 [Arenicella sp.]|jgi:hypothetical protein